MLQRKDSTVITYLASLDSAPEIRRNLLHRIVRKNGLLQTTKWFVEIAAQSSGNKNLKKPLGAMASDYEWLMSKLSRS
jgi:hypothetical protein